MTDKPKLKRMIPKVLESVKFRAPADSAGTKRFPTLYSLLSPCWADGKLVREGGSLNIRADGAAFRATVVCEGEGLQTTMISESLITLLEDLENHVTQPSCHWALTWKRAKKNLQSLESAIE